MSIGSRILILGDSFFVPVKRLVEFLVAEGRDVHLATFGHDDVPAPAHAHRIEHRGRSGLLLARRSVSRLAASLRPDIVHAFYLTSYGFLASGIRTVPVLTSAMGSDVFGAPELSRWLAPLRRALTRTALKRADRVHSVAPHMTSRLVELGADPARVTTFPRGIPLDQFPLATRGPKTGSFVLLCNRKLEPVYDHETLLEGTAGAVSRGADVVLRLVGDGFLRGRLEHRARKLGLTDRVRFEGHVEAAAMPGILAESDVFISSARSDGTSSCLLEAMASGAIPIATDIPANRPWIRPNESGYLFAPGDPGALSDAIRDAIDNRDRWEAMRIANRALVVRAGDLLRGHRLTLEIYDDLMRRRRG